MLFVLSNFQKFECKIKPLAVIGAILTRTSSNVCVKEIKLPIPYYSPIFPFNSSASYIGTTTKKWSAHKMYVLSYARIKSNCILAIVFCRSQSTYPYVHSHNMKRSNATMIVAVSDAQNTMTAYSFLPIVFVYCFIIICLSWNACVCVSCFLYLLTIVEFEQLIAFYQFPIYYFCLVFSCNF